MILEYLRNFNFLSVILRLLLAVASGFALGFGRSQKNRNAGLRTYMLVSVGAALTMLISLFDHEMLQTQWAWLWDVADVKFDGTRFSAQVISGIGFLAAGTILSVAHQQISGLTTAIGLFAAGALGIAAGAGFYEAVLAAIVCVIIAMELMHPVEVTFKRRLRNITINVEFEDISDVNTITERIKELGATIFEMEFERTERSGDKMPAAIIIMRLSRTNDSHSAMLSSVAELPCVCAVRELIS